MFGVVAGSLLQVRDVFNQHALFGLAALLLGGYFLGKVAERVKLPNITGFIIAGFLLGESGAKLVPAHLGPFLTSVTEVALGVIALTIGAEFSLAKLRVLGVKIILITVTQLMMTFAAVSLGLWLVGLDMLYALLLGAIATATAPAATVVIVQSLRVRGEFVDYLYGIVAMDDAGCVVLFSVVFAFVGAALGDGTSHVAGLILQGFSEVGGSVLLGVVAGGLAHWVARGKRSKNELMILSVGMVFLTTGIAVSLHLSPLLANMAVGATLVNLARRNERLLRVLEPLTPPLYAAFFAIAGTELNPAVMASGAVLLVGGVYVLCRAAGKYGGVYLGALAVKAPRTVRDYLGLCMLPQAGVAIGLVLFIQTTPLLASASAEAMAAIDMITNVVLFSVFINEITGPPLSRLGLIKGVLR